MKIFYLPESSTTYQQLDLLGLDPFCSVMNIELLQFYYSIQNLEGAS